MAGLPASLRFGAAPLKQTAAARPHGGAAAGSPTGGDSGGGTSKSKPSPQQPDAAAAWRAECDRVADKLVITAPADAAASGGGGEWRPQLERALSSLAALQAQAPGARAEIDAAGRALGSSLGKLAASEYAASTQLAVLRGDYQAAVAAVEALRQEHASRQEHVGTLEQELQFLNKELEERQREVAEEGDSVSDTRPVARLARACTQLREELVQMDVRGSVLQHLLLHTMAKAKAG